MAVILQMTYSKKLGLPNFSSHSCSASVTVEIADVSVAAQESSKLYALLQTAVDNEIREVGWMPDATSYGMDPSQARPSQNGNGHRLNGNGHQANGNGNGQHRNGTNADHWECTPGQAAFFKRIVNENHLDKNEVEQMSQQLFGVGARQCNKMQMAQLIDDLLEQTGQGNRRQRFTGRQPANRS